MTSEEHLHNDEEGPEPTDEEWQHIQEQVPSMQHVGFASAVSLDSVTGLNSLCKLHLVCFDTDQGILCCWDKSLC